MEDISAQSLGKFGGKFQTKTIACLLTDRSFMEQMRDILEPGHYDTNALRWICEGITKFWDEYRRPPSIDYFTTRIRSGEESEALQAAVLQELKHVMRSMEDQDLDWVKDDFLEFSQNQRIRTAILRSTDLLRQGSYGAIKREIDDALNAGVSRDLGHMYKDDALLRLTEEARPTVTTGLPMLDSLMDGGLGPGEVGTLIGASGAGKCVSGDTSVDVVYEQIGFELSDTTLWFDPWDEIEIGDQGETVTAYGLAALLESRGIDLE